MDENEISRVVVDTAVKLHMELGLGLLETVYEVVLAKRLEQQGLKVERQVPVPIVIGGIRFDEGFRTDLIVNDLVILELKSVDEISKVHGKQLLTYLRLKNMRLGLLLNFGAAEMRQGIKRVVNGLED